VIVNKVKNLQDNLLVCKYDLCNSSSAKLDCILSSQKPFEDKCGLGFDKSASALKITLVNKGKTFFVPPCVEDVPIVVDKGNGVFVGNMPMVEGMNAPRRQPPPRVVLKCYHCGRVGHI
jgi:hypothetical protein